MLNKWLQGKNMPDAYNLLRLIEEAGLLEREPKSDDPAELLAQLEDTARRVLPRLRRHLERLEDPRAAQGPRSSS
jgi:hypothetical protein